MKARATTVNKSVIISVILLLMTALLITTAAAMGFSVTPELPENQRQNGSSFFDLLVEPGMQQVIKIHITNQGSEEITVLVELITASTARNGQINYTASGQMDITLQYSFADIAAIPQSYFSIPARGEIEVPVTISVPAGRFDGAILGSIRVLREATAQEREAAGVLVNRFAKVTAVRLVQSENAEELITPSFELGVITTELINYRASVIANVRNTQPMIIKGAKATAGIFPADSTLPVFESVMENVDFAPNSIFPLSFVDRDGSGISPGDYTAIIAIEYENETWTFEEHFTITADEAVIINESALNQNTANSGYSIPPWAKIMIVSGALLLIILLVIFVRKNTMKVSVEDLLREYEAKKTLAAIRNNNRQYSVVIIVLLMIPVIITLSLLDDAHAKNLCSHECDESCTVSDPSHTCLESPDCTPVYGTVQIPSGHHYCNNNCYEWIELPAEECSKCPDCNINHETGIPEQGAKVCGFIDGQEIFDTVNDYDAGPIGWNCAGSGTVNACIYICACNFADVGEGGETGGKGEAGENDEAGKENETDRSTETDNNTETGRSISPAENAEIAENTAQVPEACVDCDDFSCEICLELTEILIAQMQLTNGHIALITTIPDWVRLNRAVNNINALGIETVVIHPYGTILTDTHGTLVPDAGADRHLGSTYNLVIQDVDRTGLTDGTIRTEVIVSTVTLNAQLVPNTSKGPGHAIEITRTNSITSEADIILAMNSNERHFIVMNGGSLTISGRITATRSQALMAANSAGGGVQVERNSVLNLSGDAVISMNRVARSSIMRPDGSAVHTNQDPGTVLLRGGMLNMSGGEISGDGISQNGVGVYVLLGEMYMTGGIIKDNCGAANSTGSTFGGGVNVNTGEVTMSGNSVISGNRANNGAGIHLFQNARFTMTAGGNQKITGNSATNSGGGVYVGRSSIFEMRGGTIGGSSEIPGQSNTSGQFSGGVHVFGEFIMSGGRISGNIAGSIGGGVGVFNDSTPGVIGKFTMTGGTIGGAAVAEGNISSTSGGGGVYVGQYSSFTVSNATISNNKSHTNGGGIFIMEFDGLDIAENVIFSGNTAGNGAFWLEDYRNDAVYSSILGTVPESMRITIGVYRVRHGTVIDGFTAPHSIRAVSRSNSPNNNERHFSYLANNFDLNFVGRVQDLNVPSLYYAPNIDYGAATVPLRETLYGLRGIRDSLDRQGMPSNLVENQGVGVNNDGAADIASEIGIYVENANLPNWRLELHATPFTYEEAAGSLPVAMNRDGSINKNAFGHNGLNEGWIVLYDSENFNDPAVGGEFVDSNHLLDGIPIPANRNIGRFTWDNLQHYVIVLAEPGKQTSGVQYQSAFTWTLVHGP